MRGQDSARHVERPLLDPELLASIGRLDQHQDASQSVRTWRAGGIVRRARWSRRCRWTLAPWLHPEQGPPALTGPADVTVQSLFAADVSTQTTPWLPSWSAITV